MPISSYFVSEVPPLTTDKDHLEEGLYERMEDSSDYTGGGTGDSGYGDAREWRQHMNPHPDRGKPGMYVYV